MSSKSRKLKGQNLVEFIAVAAVFLALSLAGLYYFGDAIANLFENNNSNTLFQDSSSRTALDPDT
ncbi:MAG: hypothetical protein A2104_10025 [Candidatus Melainabacteria bacterium GWF2_32_7]|nr:MAG: hypothetical protein A2104_10025 [Candidatus Melainabacteria bacterium GWF2_32_7]OGI22778.1 MAG: hypothetical protein A2255_02995 [Candidatus Melainabacteria bacterium RIFOXYA2_FULL_32_9]